MKVESQHTADDGVTKQHVTDQLPPQLPALKFMIQYVAEHRLAFFLTFGAGQGAFYPFIRKPAPLEILIPLKGRTYFWCNSSGHSVQRCMGCPYRPNSFLCLSSSLPQTQNPATKDIILHIAGTGQCFFFSLWWPVMVMEIKRGKKDKARLLILSLVTFGFSLGFGRPREVSSSLSYFMSV